MSPAAVEIQSPIDDQSSFRQPNPTFSTSTNATNSGLFQDRGSMHSSSSSSSSSIFGLSNGAEFVSGAVSAPDSGFQTAPRVTSGRVKPRLVKLRKPLHGGRAKTAASSEVRSGFNPFSSLGTSSNDTTTRLFSNGFSLGDNVSDCNNSFVFGAKGRDSSENAISLENGFKIKDEGVRNKNSGDTDSALDTDRNCVSSNTNSKLKEPNRVLGDSDLGVKWGKGEAFPDNKEKQSRTECPSVTSASDCNSNRDGSGREGIFVFGGSYKETLKTPESKLYSDYGEKSQDSSNTSVKQDKVPNCSPEFVFKLSGDLRKLNINSPLNVHGGNNDETLSEVSAKAAFDFSSTQKVAMQRMEAATPPPPPFSSVAQSFQQNENVAGEQIKSSSTSTADGMGIPIFDFKVPQFDPSSLKENLFTQVDSARKSMRRSRLSKDKKTKKVKEKIKQSSHSSKQNLSQGSVNTEIQSDRKLDSGCYSPMDFSPYNGETAASDFTTKSPAASSKATCFNDCGNVCSNNGAGAAVTVPSVSDEPESSSTHQFPFASGLENDKAFTFSVSSSATGNLSLRKLQSQTRKTVKKKSSRKAPTSVVYSLSSSPQNQTEDAVSSNTVNKTEKDVEFKLGSSSTSMILDACEMWRLRGNQAYRNDDMARAEACYTWGINSVPLGDNLGSYAKPLALSYGNRAAARISLGRLREALSDCEAAASLDPEYLKVYIRAANCHLFLGEVEDALQYFNKCVELSSGVCLDRRTTIEAAEGLQKAEKVAKCINQINELLKKKTSDAAVKALDIVEEALSVSSSSQKLIHMKAEALFIVQRYSEVIELCEGILHINDKNSASHGSDAELWWLLMIAKSHFSMGNLEMALDQLRKLEQVGSNITEHQNGIMESSKSLAVTISELLQCKNAGNEAVRGGRYAEAVEQYTTALSKTVSSRPFAAICFCNRAAANQAANQIADAIADCSLAMALDGNYKKAVSRRAMLHEMIRDYGQAANDLQRLITVLEKQSHKKTKTPNSSGGPLSSKKELRQARNRLCILEEEAKKGIQLDLYLILGVKTSDAATDIKKAYRKAALKHHPDKAGQLLVRSDGGDEGRLWKEIAEEVQNHADRLFKMIGEAYAVLSDPTKRSDYDADEVMRKARTSRENSRRKSSDENGYPYECSPNRRNWKENRKNYGSSPYWW